MFLTSEGGGRQQSFTQAAPNELRLGEGGVKWLELVIGFVVASGGEMEREEGVTTRRALAP